MLLAAALLLNDGYFGGSADPEQLGKSKDISMVREEIRIWVGKSSFTARCRFEFRNKGRDQRIRIGFPNLRGSDGELLFTSFRSVVDGVPVEVRDFSHNESFWKVKGVHFEQGQTRVVENFYTGRIGAHTVTYKDLDDGLVNHLSYILETGASWSGPIGHAKVVFQFAEEVIPSPIISKKLDSVPRWRSADPATVEYTGFANPRVDGRRLVFERRNFTPSQDSNIHLSWGWRVKPDLHQ